MSQSTKLLLPRPELAGCVFAAIIRDTRGQTLQHNQRFNHFPASPIVTLTHVIQGETRLVSSSHDVKNAPIWPKTSLTGPQDSPITSWNPSHVFAITVGIYPEAWQALTNQTPKELTNRNFLNVPDQLRFLFDAFSGVPDIQSNWIAFQDQLQPIWTQTTSDTTSPQSQRISDWSKSLIAKAATSGPGKSVRAMERRLSRWTGQSKQSLLHFAKIEELQRQTRNVDTSNLAGIAADAGYADQSHMGRALKRATGFSPAQLNKLVETEEAFWCYRLLGERF